MIRKTQIEVTWEDHDKYLSVGPDWLNLLRIGGIDAEAVVEIWEHSSLENVDSPAGPDRTVSGGS